MAIHTGKPINMPPNGTAISSCWSAAMPCPGYLDEVLTDTARAVEKIRKVVAIRQAPSPETGYA